MLLTKKQKTRIQDIHHVLITDEDGIQATFNQLKDKLVNDVDSFLTFIYFIRKGHNEPLFKAELDILEHRS